MIGFYPTAALVGIPMNRDNDPHVPGSRVMSQLQTVHVRVNDAATGQPTPCLIVVRDGLGRSRVPFGYPESRPGDDRPCYIDGTCEMELVPGEIFVEILKGPEYRPVRQTLTLPLGKMAMRFNLERESFRPPGWVAADTRVLRGTPHEAALEAAGEGLDVVHLLAHEESDRRNYHHVLAFSGQHDCLNRHGSRVVVNSFNQHPVLGSLALLHCHRMVHPLAFGGPGRTDDWSLADWCDQGHRKGGLVIWADPGREAIFGGEALANAIAGRIDAIECPPSDGATLELWYQLVSIGVRLPLVGASGKRDHATAVGAYRTYSRLGEASGDANRDWVESIKAGRTVAASNGHMSDWPELTVNGQICEPGAVMTVENCRVEIVATCLNALRSMRIQLIVNGQIMNSVRFNEKDELTNARLTAWPTVAGGGWVAIRMVLPDQHISLHTSPVYFRVEGRAVPVSLAAVDALDAHLIRGREWVENHGRFDKAKSRDHLLHVFDGARQILADKRQSGV